MSEFKDVDYYTIIYKKPDSAKHYCEGRYEAPKMAKNDLDTYFKLYEFIKDLENLRDAMAAANPGYECAVIHYTATVIR